MPRLKRKFSETNLHHVVFKGIGEQLIFEDDIDYLFFLNKMRYLALDHKISIYAYCLMGNHVHLVVHDPERQLSKFCKLIQQLYTNHFNRTYTRGGPLFRHPFWSEPISTSTYFWNALRYVYLNPQAANISSYKDYYWSSYQEFTNNRGIIETKKLLEIFHSLEDLNTFIEARNLSDYCLTLFDRTTHISDGEAITLLKGLLELDNLAALTLSSKEAQTEILITIKKTGLPINQLSRILKIPRGVISKAFRG